MLDNVDEQHAETLGTFLPVLLPVAKTAVVNGMKHRRLEKQKEHELELVELRQQQDQRRQPAPQPTPPDPQPVTDEESPDDTLSASLDALIEEEDCQVCTRLLEGVRNLDDDELRARAIVEYGKFKGSLDGGADADDLAEELRDLPTLRMVMEREFNTDLSE